MLSVSQAANELGISTSRVRALIKKGSLPASKVGRAWLLEEKDVLQRVSEHPKAGRPVIRENEKSEPTCETEELETTKTKGRSLYLSCKEFFRYRPSGDVIQHASCAEEASFYMAVADFFLQQRQAELVAEGVY